MRKFILTLCCLFSLSADDAPVQTISAQIALAKQTIVAQEIQNGLAEKDLLFLAFWNLDHTILDGDITEGSTDLYGKTIFKGLAQLGIESGLSKKYPSAPKFWLDYEAMEKTDAPKSYGYVAQIFAGATPNQVLRLATEYCKSTLQPYLFPASMALIAKLQANNISVQILTASPRLFAQGMAPLLRLSPQDIYGMETEVKNGILTDTMVLPLTTGPGKIEKIKLIVQEKLRQYKKVYVLAGFGNYNLNDMPFLTWIAGQQFAAGAPLAVVDYRSPPIAAPHFALLPLSREGR